MTTQLHTPFHQIRLSGAVPVLLMAQSSSPAIKGKDRHTHPEGQFYLATSGLIVVETSMGRIVMPPGRLGWIPPMVPHSATVMGHANASDEDASPGFTLYLAASLCNQFPAEPTVLTLSGLMRELLKRMQQWTPLAPLDQSQQHLLDVFIDEIHKAPPEPMMLKIPEDPVLAKMAAAIVADPADSTSLDIWGERLYKSTRTITRHFRAQTGMSIAEWRQMARIQKSLELLGTGHSVTDVSFTLGYDSVSSFIRLFKRIIGVTPAKFASQMQHK